MSSVVNPSLRHRGIVRMLLVTLGVAALFQVIRIDWVFRIISIEALGTIAIIASMVFFMCASRGNDR